MINLFDRNTFIAKPSEEVNYFERSEEDRIREFEIACEMVLTVNQAIAQICSDSSVRVDIVDLIQQYWHDPVLLKAKIAATIGSYTDRIESFEALHDDAKLYVMYKAQKQLLSKFTIEVKTID